jgi:hypothetical protein
MELPQDVMNYVKTFLPPHPLQDQIKRWEFENLFSKRKQYFHKFYFSFFSMDKKEKLTRFINDNDFWIKMSRLSNEKAIKLKHRCYLDKKRMNEKLKELNIKTYLCRVVTHIPQLNEHGNFSEVYFKDQEIIY